MTRMALAQVTPVAAACIDNAAEVDQADMVPDAMLHQKSIFAASCNCFQNLSAAFSLHPATKLLLREGCNYSPAHPHLQQNS